MPSRAMLAVSAHSEVTKVKQGALRFLLVKDCNEVAPFPTIFKSLDWNCVSAISLARNQDNMCRKC
jgi:hypothetical protein